MARRSSDYIPTEGDNASRLDDIAEYRRNHGDPRKAYTATYLICGKPVSERVMAMTQQQAVNIVKYNCSLVGWNPSSLNVTEA